MRKNETILKILTANGDHIMWIGLIQSNISNHDLFNAIAVATMIEYIEEEL